MIELQAYAKINWGLEIVDKRADGYHTLDTIMQRIALCDTITISPTSNDVFSMVTVPKLFSQENNLLYKTLSTYAKVDDLNSFFPYCITLKKQIPLCAGLGGASADAGALLLYLREHYSHEAKMTETELQELATSLGADVPFCMTQGMARCQGIGEQITSLPAKKYNLLLVQPAFGISTAALFKSIESINELPPISINQVERTVHCGDFSALKHEVTNHLQWLAEKQYPIIREIVTELYNRNASFAAMSGAGSCCFGVFETGEEAHQAEQVFNKNFFTCVTHTLLGNNDEK